MIKSYLVGFPSYYEGEDIEIRYCLFNNEEFLKKKSITMDYKKPIIVGQVALITLLKELEKDKEDDIVVMIKDPAMFELLKGTSSTQNVDALKMLRQTKKQMEKFKNLVIKDISNDKIELNKWKEALKI